MINGRHLLLLGLIACAGLISVHDGQIQTDLCYQIAAREKQLREVRDKIELDRIKHTALQSPAAVMDRAAALNLRVLPPAISAGSEAARQSAQPVRAARANANTHAHAMPIQR